MPRNTTDLIAEYRQGLKSPARRQREHEQAYAELGPRFVQRPINDLESQIPVNKAMTLAATEGRLPAIAEMARTGLLGKGSLGELNLPNIMGMVRNLARKGQDIPDLNQVGQAAMIAKMAKQSSSGPELFKEARGAVRNYQKGQTGGLGARERDVRLYEAARARWGDAGELRLLGEIRKTDPSFTLDKLRHVRGNLRQPDVRLDAPSAGRPDETIGQGLRGLSENPAQAAELREALAKLSPGEQTALLGRMSGEGRGVDTKAAARALKKLGYTEPKQISGGAAGPEDLNAEFPANAFRPQLRAQPRQMFGQEGPKGTNRPMADVLTEYQRALAEAGGGERLGRGTIPESGYHTLGAARLTSDWDRLRSILGMLGKYQGRN